MSHPETIHIVAGNIAEFKYITKKKWDQYNEQWVSDTREMYPNYVYVHNTDALRGLDEIKGFYYGSYEQRKDIEEIKIAIKLIKLKKSTLWSQPATHLISIDGIMQDPKDYTILFRDTPKGRETIVDFNQAPPAGSVINVTDITTGFHFFTAGNGHIKSFSFYF